MLSFLEEYWPMNPATLLIPLLLAAGCAAPETTPDCDAPSEVADGGELWLLTYNVAGLPEPLSQSTPEANHPLIAPLLDRYDLVLVQEDFWYHDLLESKASHRCRSVPMLQDPSLVAMTDGLSRFSRFPFSDFARFAWNECSGRFICASDCLAPKGFTRARTRLADGAEVDVYNLHMDAGSCQGDLRVRGAQVQQLLEELSAYSSGRAVVVAGDFNLSPDRPEDEEVLNRLLSQASLRGACREVECRDEGIDRVLYRSSAAVRLEPLRWQRPDDFVDGDGVDLSDHRPVAVQLGWQLDG